MEKNDMDPVLRIARNASSATVTDGLEIPELEIVQKLSDKVARVELGWKRQPQHNSQWPLEGEKTVCYVCNKTVHLA